MPYMQKEWAAKEGYLPAISIQQPFIMAIVQGKKSIETRTWGTRYRGTLLLHSGKKWAGQDGESDWSLIAALRQDKPFVKRLGLPGHYNDYPRGAIVGIATLVRCAKFTEEGWYKLQEQHQHDGYWDESKWGWQLENVRRFVEPVPFRGQLGLFPVEEALEVEVEGKVVRLAEQIANAIPVPFTPVARPESPEDRYRPSGMVARYGRRLPDDWYPQGSGEGYHQNEFEPL